MVNAIPTPPSTSDSSPSVQTNPAPANQTVVPTTEPPSSSALSTLRATINSWPPQLLASIGLSIIILIGAVGWKFFLSEQSRYSIISLDLPENLSQLVSPAPAPPSPIPTIPPSPTPKPIATGEQGYSIRSGNETGPSISRVVVSEFDPAKNQTQSFLVKLDPRGSTVEGVSIELITDNDRQTHQLQKMNTDPNGTQTWQGTWTTSDTHDFIYTAIVTAKSNQGTAKVDLSFR